MTAFWGSGAAVTLAGTKWTMVVIFVICLVLLRRTKLNPVWVMVLAGVMKVAVALVA